MFPLLPTALLQTLVPPLMAPGVVSATVADLLLAFQDLNDPKVIT